MRLSTIAFVTFALLAVSFVTASTESVDNERAGVKARSLNHLISASPVVVFSKTYCPYCAKVKTILSSYPLTTSVIFHELGTKKGKKREKKEKNRQRKKEET